MQRRFLILYSALCLSLLAYFLHLRRENAARVQAEITAQTPDPALEEARIQEEAEYQQQADTRVQQLAKLESSRAAREIAAGKMFEARTQLQASKAPSWTSVRTTNWEAFETLRHKADTSSSGTAECTLCDGRGVMRFCVLCDNTGKCPTCKGSGKRFGENSCLTCAGTGKCYICSGLGRMTCLFCDDGTISRKTALPPTRIPVRCEPVTLPDRNPVSLARESSEPEVAEETKTAAETKAAEEPTADQPEPTVAEGESKVAVPEPAPKSNITVRVCVSAVLLVAVLGMARRMPRKAKTTRES